jgi:hypothetical protein
MKQNLSFDLAVADYIASLNENQRQILRAAALNSQTEVDWPWFADVIDRYHLRDKNSPVARDISNRVAPDPYGFNNSLWAGIGAKDPVFEAMTLLDAVQETLKVQQHS